MERVIFVVEGSGERISCLLNPENLVFHRRSGTRTRTGASGIVTGHAMSDDPVIATGGGRTQFELDLLFDTAIAQESVPVGEAGPALTDVRTLTRPIWNLAENPPAADRSGSPAGVRFIWGMCWNILATIIAVSERLERFTPEGEPQRSWLRLRLRRLNEAAHPAATTASVTPRLDVPAAQGQSIAQDAASVQMMVDPDGMPQLRLDQIAAVQYGDPSAWRVLAAVNGIADPLDIPEGTVLRLPRLDEVRSP